MASPTKAEIIVAMAEMYATELTELSLDLYLSAIEEFTDEQVEAAAKHILRTRKYTKMPMPADFVEYISPPTQVEIQANRAWQELCDAVEIAGPYRSVQFKDPAITATLEGMGGWVDYCNRTRPDSGEELHWLQKEFERMYARYATVPDLRTRPFLGLCDKDNGKPPANPMYLGYSQDEIKQLAAGEGPKQITGGE